MQVFLYGVIKRLKNNSDKAGLARDLNDKEPEFRAFLDNNTKWNGLQELYELLCLHVYNFWRYTIPESYRLTLIGDEDEVNEDLKLTCYRKFPPICNNPLYPGRPDFVHQCREWAEFIYDAAKVTPYFNKFDTDLSRFEEVNKHPIDKLSMENVFRHCGIIPNPNHDASNDKAEESGKRKAEESDKGRSGKRRSGRPRARFEDAIMGKYESRTKEIIEKIRAALHGRRGKAAAEVIAGAMELGYIRKPTYAEFRNEFGKLIESKDYYYYLTDYQLDNLQTYKIINLLKLS